MDFKLLLVLLKEHNMHLYAILNVTVSRRATAPGNENDILTFACDLSNWTPTDYKQNVTEAHYN